MSTSASSSHAPLPTATLVAGPVPAASTPTHTLQLQWAMQPATSELLPQIASLEADNYPADEACSPENFAYRLQHAAPFFKAAVGLPAHSHSSPHTKPPSVIGFVVGTLSASAELSHESMFAHDPQGAYLCIHSVCVSRALHQQGLGRAIFKQYLQLVTAEQRGHLKAIVLICKQNLVRFYESCGFILKGPSLVVHGAEQWFECRIDLEAAAPRADSASIVPNPAVAPTPAVHTAPPSITSAPSATSATSAPATAAKSAVSTIATIDNTPLIGTRGGASDSQAPIPIWLDCDPGHDDAMAIILAAFSSRLRLVGVSTVSGNQSIEKTTLNARNVLNLIGRGELLVHPGREHPIVRERVLCPEIHGESGLEANSGSVFPPLQQERPGRKKAYEAMAEAVLASQEPLTLIATGPLTNVALLILTHPELFGVRTDADGKQIPSRVREIVLMGGAVGVGNTGAAAEFNIEADAEAAAIVFGQANGVPITMCPLEVTHTALVTPAVLARVQAIGAAQGAASQPPQPTPFARLVCDLLLFFRDSYATFFGFADPPLHDPCAVAWLIAPELFTTKEMRVEIDTKSALCYGRTVCDVYRRSDKPPNVRVCLTMDVERFWVLMLAALEKANAVAIAR